MGLFFDFFVFYLVSIKLEGEFQINILSSFNRGSVRFGYRGTFFHSQAISLWFSGNSKLRWLVQLSYISPSNRVRGKFETCENKLELLSVKVETSNTLFKRFFEGRRSEFVENVCG